MIDPGDSFSATYAEARGKFLAAAGTAGLRADSHFHPLPGRDAEPLAVDVVIDGRPEADDLLIVSSGCHGVEGFGGSGAQIAALRDTALREEARSNAVTLVHIHALNPHGFSHWRRNTHENVRACSFHLIVSSEHPGSALSARTHESFGSLIDYAAGLAVVMPAST